MQQDLFGPFIPRWTSFLMMRNPTHPFIVGLNTFRIPEVKDVTQLFNLTESFFFSFQLLVEVRSVRSLFVPIPWTFEGLKFIIVLDPASLRGISDEGTKRIMRFEQRLSFHLFIEFVRRVAGKWARACISRSRMTNCNFFCFSVDGEVQVATGPLTLKQLFEFATGSFQIPRKLDGLQNNFQFLPSRGSLLNRPTATTCLNTVVLPIVKNVLQMEEIWISAFNIEGLSFGRA